MPRCDDERQIGHGVFLVGAGPGDLGLLTLRAHELIMSADVVVFDRLVSEEILDIVPEGVGRIDVGKRPNCHPVPQDEINVLLATLARKNRTVVRLKGGDPFVFGRGSEEAAYLIAKGIPCHVVPGVTAANGCAAAAGIPLTHRGAAKGVRYVTGHCRDDEALDFDWAGLADPETTLVIYMGAANMMQIAIRLMTEGLPAATPAAAISQGTTPRQQVAISTLGEIATVVADLALPSPVMFIVGRVVGLSETLEGLNTDGSDVAHAVAAAIA